MITAAEDIRTQFCSPLRTSVGRALPRRMVVGTAAEARRALLHTKGMPHPVPSGAIAGGAAGAETGESPAAPSESNVHKAPSQDELRAHIASGQSDFDADGEWCVIQDRLYLAKVRCRPEPDQDKFFLTLSKSMRYIPFCADFGPFNLGDSLHPSCPTQCMPHDAHAAMSHRIPS